MTYPRSRGARADLQTWATFWGPRKASANNSPKAKSSLPLVGRTRALTRDFTEKWHPTPGLLPGKPHGQKSLVGHRPWGCRVEATERLHFLSFLQRKLHYLFQDKKHDFKLQSSNVILQKNSILFIHRLTLKKIITKYCYYILKFINWKFVFSLT